VVQTKRHPAFWVICSFFVLFIVLLLVGQTTAMFAYDFAVSIGLQESVDVVTPFGVEVNRAFGFSDTFVYIPLMIIALVGLSRRRRWALPVTGAAMGISVYWAVTITSMMSYLRSVPGYTLEFGIEYVVFMGTFIVVGVWGLIYLSLHGDRLIR
jgi:hypothetical protein